MILFFYQKWPLFENRMMSNDMIKSDVYYKNRDANRIKLLFERFNKAI